MHHNYLKHRPVANFENRYRISCDGTIMNLANNSPLTHMRNPNGYYKVSLADGEGGATQKSVHRLVAEHFIPNPYGYAQINHINGNKADNRYFNLEWCSCEQNVQHALKTGLRPGYMSADDKERYMRRILSGEQVKDLAIELNRAPETLHKFFRTTAARLGLTPEWLAKMKENRKNAAIRNLAKVNNNYTE